MTERADLTIEGWNVAQLSAHWGAAILVVGLLACACLVLMNRLTTFEISMAMFVAGLFQVSHAISAHRRGWSVFAITASLLYLVAATAMLLEPFAGGGGAMWVLIISLACSGISRIRVSMRLSGGAARWEALSGIVSILAAALMGFGLPFFTLWPIAFVVGIDLIIEGSALANAGFALVGVSERRVR